MKTLYKWYLTNEGIVGYMAHGVVYGHSSPYCADGSEIHTSLIESAEYDGETITLYTLNSEYRLSISEMDWENSFLKTARYANALTRCVLSIFSSDLRGNTA